MHRRSFSLLIVLCLLLLSSCTSRTPSADTSRPQPTDTLALRIACLPTMACLPFYYAAESGLADSLHLSLVVKTYAAQFDADTALMGRTVDAGVADAARLEYYRTQGKLTSLQRILPLQERWSLLANSRRRIANLSKLKGRTIAIARHAASERYLIHLRDSLRFKEDELFTPQVNNFRLRLQMLDNEQVDAAFLPEPYAELARLSGHTLLSTASAQRYPLGLYATSRVQKNQRKAAQLKRLVQVYNQAIVQLNRKANPLRDSLLIHKYQLPQESVDKLRLPLYAPMR